MSFLLLRLVLPLHSGFRGETDLGASQSLLGEQFLGVAYVFGIQKLAIVAHSTQTPSSSDVADEFRSRS